jgi:hypothetical protein
MFPAGDEVALDRLEEEAKRLQAMVRGSVLAGPFSTD